MDRTDQMHRVIVSTVFTSIILLLGNFALGEVIYTISPDTNFGNNGANGGGGMPTFTDNGDGSFTLAHDPSSGNNNAAFVDSGDNTGTTINGWTNAVLGRDLLTTDSVIISGSVEPLGFYNPIANGFEFGIESVQGFRSQPNILFQVRAFNTTVGNSLSGTAPFFDYVANGAGINNRNNASEQVDEASAGDGFSFKATYTESLFTFEVFDIEVVDTGATSLIYEFDPTVDATSSGATSGFDFLTDVGDGFAYYSQQKQAVGDFPMIINAFQIEVTGDSAVDGDFDDNGIYDCADVDALVEEIATMGNAAAFDLTGDALVNNDDLGAWLSEAGEVNLGAGLSYLPGDATLDGVVDVSDFNTWNSNKFTTQSGVVATSTPTV